jgi:epsilon-lactone hydrolase
VSDRTVVSNSDGEALRAASRGAGIRTAHLIVAALVVLQAPVRLAASPPPENADGAVHVSEFLLPESSLLNEATRTSLKEDRERQKSDEAEWNRSGESCPSKKGATREQMPAIRRCEAKALYRSSLYKRFLERYPTIMSPQEIDGVYTEVFTPKDGIAARNKDRVLINVHGGHFQDGSRTFGHLESMPIASKGKIKVVSIDYRQAPEHVFPAASEDVAAVYRDLIKVYQPKNVGIYGCSAGALLTAESVAWFQKKGLPPPGAVGMFGGAAAFYHEGDSGRLASAMSGFPVELASQHPYFKGTDEKDPLAFPIHSAQIMAKFPPSLLIATTRDIGQSAVVYTHSQLVKLGVDAQLHVWEGVAHCFPFGQEVPESDEAHDVIVRFFDQHLGKHTQLTKASDRKRM